MLFCLLLYLKTNNFVHKKIVKNFSVLLVEFMIYKSTFMGLLSFQDFGGLIIIIYKEMENDERIWRENAVGQSLRSKN